MLMLVRGQLLLSVLVGKGMQLVVLLIMLLVGVVFYQVLVLFGGRLHCLY
jgi:hypothetical protein